MVTELPSYASTTTKTAAGGVGGSRMCRLRGVVHNTIWDCGEHYNTIIETDQCAGMGLKGGELRGE